MKQPKHLKSPKHLKTKQQLKTKPLDRRLFLAGAGAAAATFALTGAAADPGGNAWGFYNQNGDPAPAPDATAPTSDPTAPTTDTATVTRPSGPDYVRYEDLFAPGDDLQTVFNKVPYGKIITFPAGEFTWTDFKSPNGWHDGIRLPTGLKGIAGSGIGLTRFRMVPNSSTQAYVEPSSGTNPLYMWFMDNGDQSPVFQDFSLIGTEQGHHYNGFGIANTPNATFQRIKFHGANRGYGNYPPGETFSLGQNRSDNTQVIDVEFDNRDEATGERVGASALGFNNSRNAVVKRVYAHHGVSGMVTFWNTENIYTEDIHTWTQGTGGGALSSCGINHENTTGVIRHIRPKLIVAGRYSDQKLTDDGGLHLSFGNSYSDLLDAQIHDPVFDKSENATGALAIQISDSYPTQQIRTMPQVYFNGALARSIDRNSPGDTSGATPNNAWFRYH
jgi:hypothetical protein